MSKSDGEPVQWAEGQKQMAARVSAQRDLFLQLRSLVFKRMEEKGAVVVSDVMADEAVKAEYSKLCELAQEYQTKFMPQALWRKSIESRVTATAATPTGMFTQEPAIFTKPPLPVCLMFPGQGSQYVKMLNDTKDLPDVQHMLTRAKDILGYDLLKLCLEGSEEKLAETRYCQPAMFVAGLAGMSKLRGQKPEVVERPQCMAGLSLGEYTALCAAGVLTFEDGLRLVKLRAEAMHEAASACKQGMLSVAGLERTVLEELCKEAAGSEQGGVCEVANALFSNGFACAGSAKAVEKLNELSLKRGALQSKMLKTSGAFHTSLMQPAQDKLQEALQAVLPNMKPPTCRIYMNVTGKAVEARADPRDLVELLGKQLVNPVLWEPTMRQMIQDGITEFYECGPQKQLKAMMKRIDHSAWQNTTNVEV